MYNELLILIGVSFFDMFVYNLIIIVLAVAFLFSLKNQHLKYCNTITFFLCIFLWILAANHSLEVGTDTFNYYQNFTNVLNEKNMYYNQGLQRGWYFYNLLLYKFGNYDIFMYVCYGMILGGVFTFIRKCSPNSVMSLFLFVLLYYYCNSLNIMRQFIAIGIVLIAYALYLNKNNKKYIISICLASLFHYTAILLLPICFLTKIKLSSKLVYLLVVVSFLLGFFLQDYVKPIVDKMLLLSGGFEGMAFYLENWGGERNLFSNIAINSVFILTYYLSKDKNNSFLLLYLMSVLLSNMFGAMGQANRFFIYFQITMLAVIPRLYYELRRISFIKASAYLIVILVYAYSIWYLSIDSNASEVVPFLFR